MVGTPGDPVISISRMREASWPPQPPVELPPARTVTVPGRGELFLRDTGGDGPPVMLLHGWIVSADLNWWGAYEDLRAAGYRVLAIDHRGHGRGMRPLERFRLGDCAADAAGALRQLGAIPAIVVGYSMGGAVAQLVARDHSDVLAGLILSATAQHWKDRQTRRYWRLMGVLGLMLSLAPLKTWRWGLRRVGIPENEQTAWLLSELTRGSARDIAEAGREMERFDSRPWLGPLKVPSAVVVTTRDEVISPGKQRELAAALEAQVFEAAIRHNDISYLRQEYDPALLEALTSVRAATPPAGAMTGRRTAA
jgi:pimeloyl-ACP methyl ester carboxylesterase